MADDNAPVRALTAGYRTRQLAVRSRAVKTLATLWRGVDPTNLTGTIDPFTRAAVQLSEDGSDQSAALGAAYYRGFRDAVRPGGRMPGFDPAEHVPAVVAAGALRGAALGGIVDARRAGKSLTQASDSGFTRVAGALIKLVLTGGRMTIIGASQADAKALGWQRVTSGDPCPFCRMVAGRGAVYQSERSADFTAHDTCGCTVRPVFSPDPDAQTRLWAKQYKDAQTWAKTNVTRSGRTDNDALNNLRLYVAAGTPDVA